MCGIAGWIDWEWDLSKAEEILKKMAGRIAHRGPDEQGLWAEDRAGLAHRRLVVVDPAGGKQPMVRCVRGKEYVLVYNGELYNTPELRGELQSLGYDFAGYSDTETLLYAFIEWQEECLQRLNGIYAFAVWNSSDRKLFLARDRLGVKPLFYALLPHGLVFGSEQKALLAHPLVKAEVGPDGLLELLAMGPARTPGHGVFRGIHELRPGWYAWYTKEAGLSQHRYWQLEPRAHKESLPDTIAHVRWLLQDAVQRQLVSDVPLCTFLSGGLDSSAITAIAGAYLARERKQQLATFALDFAGSADHFVPTSFQPETDAAWAVRTAKELETSHRTVLLTSAELAAALRTAMQARDLPGMADIDASLYLLSVEVKKRFTVALSGECADEVFGGYPWFYSADALRPFPWSPDANLRKGIMAPWLKERLSPEMYIQERFSEALAEVPHLPGESVEGQRIRSLFYLNLTRWMPTLLDRKDRMSMAAGLEVRVPFCDHRLVEYAFNIPWQMKNVGGQRKGVLREALRGILPESVRTRPKNPFPAALDLTGKDPGIGKQTACTDRHEGHINVNPGGDLVRKLPSIDSSSYKPLREQVYAALRKAILTGLLQPGEAIAEGYVAEQLNVSRTPVREALRMLSTEGLVVIVPRRGAYVAGIRSEKEIDDVFRVRLELEGLAARLATARMKDPTAAKLNRCQGQIEEAVRLGDLQRCIALDGAFHRLIYQASGNQWLQKFLDTLFEQIARFRIALFYEPGLLHEMIAEHRQLLNAMTAGDQALAQEVGEAHIRKAWGRVLAVFRKAQAEPSRGSA